MSDVGDMMGRHEGHNDLFSYQVDVDRRVRGDHPQGRVCSMVDFTFVRTAIEHMYGPNGDLSIDPVVLVKLIFLLFSENARSERFPTPTRIVARSRRGSGASLDGGAERETG